MTRQDLLEAGWNNAMIDHLFTEVSAQSDSPISALREERRQHALTKRQLRDERYARNIASAAALVGWVIALAALGGVAS